MKYYTEDGSELEAEPTFTNIYEAAACTLDVKADKVLTGRELKAEEFTFRLKAVKAPEGVEMPAEIIVKNDAFGAIDFGTLTFDQVGEYVFVAEEGYLVGVQNGLTYSDEVYTLHVMVTDDLKGQLHAQQKITLADTEASGMVFHNAYGAQVNLVITATKEISGREFMDGDSYTFMISGSEGAPMPQSNTVTITPADGNSALITFSTITFTQADAGKTYIYELTEAQSMMPGISIDRTVKTVEVTVSDDGMGTLSLTGFYRDDGEITDSIIFRNVYHADGTLPLVLTKNMIHREFMEGDTFTFVIRAKDDGKLPVKNGEEVSTVTITPVSGSSMLVDFGEFKFTEQDVGKTYTYEVFEADGSDRRMIYDTEPRTFTVSIEDAGNGTVNVTPTYPKDGLVFNNEYIAPIDIVVHKVWRDPFSSRSRPDVTVKLVREDDPSFSMTGVLSYENNWTYTFYDLDSDHVYNVIELDVPEKYEVTITREGNTFTVINTIDPILFLPQTGDDSKLMLWMLTAAAGLLGILLLRKQRSKA